MTRSPNSVGLVLLVVCVVACGDASRGATESLQFSVDSTGAFPVVRNSGPAPRWALDPIGMVGSVGSAGEPAPDEFGRVSSVTPGPGESVWVADRYLSQIKVFGPDGALQMEIGRQGQGPGEFGSLYSLAWVGDVLLALDFTNGRIAELSSDGRWLGSRRAPGRVSGSGSLLRFYPVSDTTTIQWSISAVDGELERTWLLHGVGGVIRGWPQRQRESSFTGVVCDRPDGSIHFFDVPIAGELLYHPRADGSSYETWTESYRYVVVDPSADTLLVVERDWPLLPISDELWEEATAAFEEFKDEAPDADCDARAIPRPAYQAPLRNLLVDDEQRVWVEAVQADGTVWEIFTPEGRLVASLPGFSYDESVPPTIRGGVVAWVQTDSLGVQFVRWARITDSSSS